MNAPVLWIFLPLAVAGVLLILSRKPMWVRWLGFGSALAFALLARVLPIGSVITLGPWSGEVSSQLVFFGRRFLILEADRPLLVLLFSLLSFWFLLGIAGSIPLKLFPLGLVAVSLVITGYAVEPVFYAAIFFGFLAMVSVILLTPTGSPPSDGVMRFLTFQVLGTICILFAAWLLSWVDLETVAKTLVIRTMILMGLGFSFLLGIFPFTSWISMLAEDTPPFFSAFVFVLYLNGVLLFALKYLSQTAWILDWVDILGPMGTVGLLMVAIGGISAMFITHGGRMMGAAVIVELGRSLVAFSIRPFGFHIYFPMLLVQGIALGIWSLALTSFQRQTGDLTYHRIHGLAWKAPLISLGLFGGLFTLAGLPFGGGFPLHWSLGTMLIENTSRSALWLLIGNVGLLIGGIRTISVLSRRDETNGGRGERLDFTKVLILLSCIGLAIMGLFPQLFMKWAASLVSIFQ